MILPIIKVIPQIQMLYFKVLANKKLISIYIQ